MGARNACSQVAQRLATRYIVNMKQYRTISIDLGNVDGLCFDTGKLRELLDRNRISNSIEVVSRSAHKWLRQVPKRTPTSVFIDSRDRAARASKCGPRTDPLGGRSTVSPSSPPTGVLRAAGLRKRQRGPFLEALAGMR